MPKNEPLDKELYQKVKKIADDLYDKPSAYKSGFIVKTYKQFGGEYSGKKTKQGLTRWYDEMWSDVGNKPYKVYRPSKRVSKNTPLLPSEIDPTNLKRQIELKQKLKGDYNLPPFIPKRFM